MMRALFFVIVVPTLLLIGCFGGDDSGGLVLGGGGRYDGVPVVDLRTFPDTDEFQVSLVEGSFHDDLLVCIALTGKYAYQGLSFPDRKDGLSLAERKSIDEFWVLIPAGRGESSRYSSSSVVSEEYLRLGDDMFVDMFIKSDFVIPVKAITTLGRVVVDPEQYPWYRYQVHGADIRVAAEADD